ncbi:MAG TPA: helix-turn-helix domain-containing protein [Dehalococcoidia bacterium]
MDATASPEQRILDAAARCLVSKGYAGTSLRQIAAEAGVALGLLHYYFRSKDDLLLALVSRTIRRNIDSLHNALGAARSSTEHLHLGLQGIRRDLERNRDDHVLLLELVVLALRKPAIAEKLRELYGELLEAVTVECRRAVEELGVRAHPEFNPRVLATALVGMHVGLAIQLLLDPGNRAALRGMDAITGILEATGCYSDPPR